jgi:hypothetical protein
VQRRGRNLCDRSRGWPMGSGAGPGGGVAEFVALGLGDRRGVCRASPLRVAGESVAVLRMGCVAGCARRRGHTPGRGAGSRAGSR